MSSRERSLAKGTTMPGVNRASGIRVVIALVAPLILIGVLCWPLLFTDATFNEDWLNHLWYIWHQSLSIRAEHLPSLFLDYSKGVLYPLYAFYGGTIYALAGALSLVLGDAPLETYILTYVLGFVAAYGGWYWMARMFGLEHWQAHIPGLLFITAAPYLMLIYGIGDWPEFLAVSSMPLLIVAGLSVLRAHRLHMWPGVALAGSGIVFFGSHILTVIWGSTVLAVVGLMIVAGVPQARAAATRVGSIRVAGLLGLALLVSSWFLLPMAAYESHTVIARSYPIFRKLLRSTSYTVAFKHLFTLSRGTTAGTILTVALPVLAILWVFGGIVIGLLSGQRGTWMRVLLIVSIVTVAIIVTMTHVGLILSLPRLYATVQFSYRLEGYVLLGVSGAVLAVLVMARNGARKLKLWTWMLVPILIVSIVGAVQQTDAYNHGRSRSIALSSYLNPIYEEEGLLDYVDDSLRYNPSRLPEVDFHPRGDHASVTVHLVPGQRIDTNIRADPNLVHITGARIVGDDTHADDILEVGTGELAGKHGALTRIDRRSPATEIISVSPANSLPVVFGRTLTVIAIIVLALQLVVAAARDRAARRARR
jgi:hypothetical protein